MTTEPEQRIRAYLTAYNGRMWPTDDTIAWLVTDTHEQLNLTASDLDAILAKLAALHDEQDDDLETVLPGLAALPCTCWHQREPDRNCPTHRV